jgi:MarR family
VDYDDIRSRVIGAVGEARAGELLVPIHWYLQRLRLGFAGRPNATGVVTTLESRGFVRRRKDARDSRMVVVSLTADGKRKIENLFPRFNAEEVVVTAHLEPAR